MGTAKLFLDTVTVSDYKTLKECLISEFKKIYSSIELHKMLANNKKREVKVFMNIY